MGVGDAFEVTNFLTTHAFLAISCQPRTLPPPLPLPLPPLYLVDDGLLDVPLDGAEHLRVDNARQHADRVGAVEVIVRVHVLGERRGDDDHVVRVASLGVEG